MINTIRDGGSTTYTAYNTYTAHIASEEKATMT